MGLGVARRASFNGDRALPLRVCFRGVRPPGGIDGGEGVVAGFEGGEEGSVPGFVTGELGDEVVEIGDMLMEPFPGVIASGPHADEEGPVAGLGEEEFAGGLAEGALTEGIIATGPGEAGHLDGHATQGALHPGIGFVEPDGEMAAFAPGGVGGSTHGKGGEGFEMIREGGHAEGGGIGGDAAGDGVEEVGSFEPPMAEEFGVVGGDQEGGLAGCGVIELTDTFGDEVGGVFAGGGEGGAGLIKFLGKIRTGDAVIADAGGDADIGAGGEGGEVTPFGVIGEIAMEFAIAWIAGITAVSAPDLACAGGIASEGGDTGGGEDGAEDALGRGGLGEQKAVGFEDEPAEAGLVKGGFDGGGVGTFR